MNIIGYHTITGTFSIAKFYELNDFQKECIGTAWYVADITYPDEYGQPVAGRFGLYEPDDYIKYNGRTYSFGDMDRLCMVWQNESLERKIDALP